MIMSRPRILLADEHVLIQEGLRRMLEPQHNIVDAVSDGRSLVDAALRLKPDLIILDVTMPLLSGMEAARQIRKRLPRIKLLFLTGHANPAYLREALSAGATGYILKSSTREQILDAVKTVLAGQRYLSHGVVAEDFDLSQWGPGKTTPRAVLTSRERQVLQLLAEGHTAKEVAASLNISHKTVAFHRNNVKRKLGLRKTVELIKRAIDEGFI